MTNYSKTVQPSLLVQKSWQIEQLPNLSPQDSEKLKSCGIETTSQLLQQASSLSQKQSLSARLEVHIQHIHKWVALADLSRIPSVGRQYCGLLLHTGVCSAAQLAQMNTQDLQRQVLRFQAATLQRRDLCPDAGQIATWIYEAKRLKHKGWLN